MCCQECAPQEGVSQGTQDGPDSVPQGTEDGPKSVSQGPEDGPEDVSQGMEDDPDLASQSSHQFQECQTATAQLDATVEEALVEMSEAVAQHDSMVGARVRVLEMVLSQLLMQTPGFCCIL